MAASFEQPTRQTKGRKNKDGESAGPGEKIAFRHIDDHLLEQQRQVQSRLAPVKWHQLKRLPNEPEYEQEQAKQAHDP